MDSKQHQGSITNKRGLSNVELSTFDLPLTNPFSFVNSCCGTVVIRPNPAQVASLRPASTHLTTSTLLSRHSSDGRAGGLTNQLLLMT